MNILMRKSASLHFNWHITTTRADPRFISMSHCVGFMLLYCCSSISLDVNIFKWKGFFSASIVCIVLCSVLCCAASFLLMEHSEEWTVKYSFTFSRKPKQKYIHWYTHTHTDTHRDTDRQTDTHTHNKHYIAQWENPDKSHHLQLLQSVITCWLAPKVHLPTSFIYVLMCF